jgi:NADPH2:quinone reductase
MKAIVAHEYGPIGGLVYQDWPEPKATTDGIVIETEAIGVNFPDGLLVQGLYQARPETPFVPGMEAVGRIISVGEAVRSVKVGDRVAVLPSIGAYAERIAVSETAATKIPEGMDAGHACALLCGYGTALHALKQRGQLAAGETVCVLGASGLTGLAAVQIGKVLGARVIGVASSIEKQEIARRAGADVVLGYGNLRDALKEVTGGKGVDVAFDPVGGDMFDILARAMGWNGRLLVIGFASGRIPQLPVNLALVKGYSVVGVFWGSFTRKEPEAHAANMRQLISWYEEGRIKPMIEGIYPLAEAASALERIHSRGASGKLILHP